MIISIEKKFIFVANLKTASTSIEAALRPHGDIVVRRSELGKHLSYLEMKNRFKWIFDVIDDASFYKFAVIRDPLDYAISLYRSHSDEKFKNNQRLYTGGMSFDDFLDVWVPQNKGQLQPQSLKFKNEKNQMALDFLILYSDLERQFPIVMRNIGIPEIALEKLNASPDLQVEVGRNARSEIENMMSDDYELIEKYCLRSDF